MDDAWRNQFLRNRPAKHPFYSGNSAVYSSTAQPLLNQVSLYGFERQRAEISGPGMTVELAKWPEGQPDIIQFPGGLPVLLVMPFGEPQIQSNYLRRIQVLVRFRRR